MADSYYKKIIERLQNAGFSRVPGGKGSHEKWRGPDGRTVIVPNSKSRHTANQVMKQAGLAHRF